MLLRGAAALSVTDGIVVKAEVQGANDDRELMVTGPAESGGEVGSQVVQGGADVMDELVQIFDFLFDGVAEESGVQLDDRAMVNEDEVAEERRVGRGAEGKTGRGGGGERSQRREEVASPSDGLDAADTREEPSEEAAQRDELFFHFTAGGVRLNRDDGVVLSAEAIVSRLPPPVVIGVADRGQGVQGRGWLAYGAADDVERCRGLTVRRETNTLQDAGQCRRYAGMRDVGPDRLVTNA